MDQAACDKIEDIRLKEKGCRSGFNPTNGGLANPSLGSNLTSNCLHMNECAAQSHNYQKEDNVWRRQKVVKPINT